MENRLLWEHFQARSPDFVGVTPAAGFVSPMSALFIGLSAGSICYFAVNEMKERFGYDDTLDVFGIHGVAGVFGALMTGVLATGAVNPIFKDVAGNPLPVGLIDGNAMQIVNQFVAVALTVLFAGVGALVILKTVDFLFGLRVSEEHEVAGLDMTQHGEVAYVYASGAATLTANNSAARYADERELTLTPELATSGIE